MTRTGEVWIEQGEEEMLTERPEYPAQDTSKAVLHYHRPDGNYEGWACTSGPAPLGRPTGRSR